MFYLRTLLAVVAPLLFRLSIAQNSSNSTSACSTPPGTSYYNASGSIIAPGPRVNDSYPSETWTWTQYVSDVYNVAYNDSSIEESIGLQTSPLQNLSDPGLPYTGCIIIPFDLNPSSDAENDNGTCNSVLGSDCLNELISVVNSSAQMLSGTQAGSMSTFSCPELLGSVGDSNSKCKNYWGGSVSGMFLPNNFTGPLNSRCLVGNPGDGNFTNTLFGYGVGGGSGINNFTAYDRAIRTPQPVIVATWLKATDNTTFGSSLGWADTQVMCIKSNITQPGSRNITEAEADKAAGAPGRIQGLGRGMFAVVGLTVCISLLL